MQRTLLIVGAAVVIGASTMLFNSLGRVDDPNTHPGATSSASYPRGPIKRPELAEETRPSSSIAHDLTKNDVVATIQGTYANQSDRIAAIIANLKKSGPAPVDWIAAASRFKALIDSEARKAQTTEWGCFRTGCFFRQQVPGFRVDDNIAQGITNARNEATQLNALTAIIGEDETHRLIVIVNTSEG